MKTKLLILLLTFSIAGFSQHVRHDQLREPAPGTPDSVIGVQRDGAKWSFVLTPFITDSFYYEATAKWLLSGDTIPEVDFTGYQAKADTSTYDATKYWVSQNVSSPWIADANGINYQAGNVGIGAASQSFVSLNISDSDGNSIQASGRIKTNDELNVNETVRLTSSGQVRALTFVSTYDSYTAIGSQRQGNFRQLNIGESGGSVVIDINKNATFAKVTADSIFTTKSGGWADKTFEKTYKLAPLDKELSFIKSNKHLRSLPSEKNRNKNLKKEWVKADLHAAHKLKPETDSVLIERISLQQMQNEAVGMLEEIEKLYLYIDQLNERIKQLENK